MVRRQHPVPAQGEEHPAQARVQQLVRRPVQAGLIGDPHPGQQLRLQAVGLQGVEPAQHRAQLLRLGGGHRVGKDRGLHVLGQPLDGLGGDVGVHHHQLGVLQQLGPGGQKGRGDMAVDLHVGQGQLHLAPLAGDEEVGGGALPRHLQRPADVDAQLPAGGGDALGVGVVPKGGEQPGVHPQQGHVVGDVPAHAPQAHAHPARVGVPGDQGAHGPSADVHVGSPHHHRIGRGAQDVAPPGDMPLLHQIRHMDRRRGPGDPRLVCQLLLADHRVLFNPAQELTLTLCHPPHS